MKPVPYKYLTPPYKILSLGELLPTICTSDISKQCSLSPTRQGNIITTQFNN